MKKPYGILDGQVLFHDDSERPPYLDCLNRSTSYSLQGCSGCSGNVQIKIYECSVHGRCAIRSLTSLIQSCCKCKDVKTKG